MRSLIATALTLLVSTAAFAVTNLPPSLGLLVTHPQFMALVTKATEEVKAAERNDTYFLDAVHAEKQKAHIHLLANLKGELTEELNAEFEVQAQALGKLRAEKNFNFNRVSLGSFEYSNNDKSVTVVLNREDVHHYPPHFTAFKTIQADLEGGYGDYTVEISNIRFAK